MNYLKTFLPYLFGNKKGKSLDLTLPNPIPWTSLNFEETLMFHALSHSLDQFVDSLDLTSLTESNVFHLYNFLEFLNHTNKTKLETYFEGEFKFFSEAKKSRGLSKSQMQELLNFKTNKLTVFAILSNDRTRIGRLLIRDESGKFVTKEFGHIWSIPVLGLSSRGLPFHHTNGCTPAGIYTIDSVKPLADNQKAFGEFRRLIMNFINKSSDEAELRCFLPSTHHSLDWWKQSVVARNLGRSLLRIHGTGMKNRNPFGPHYPFVPTSGCLATKETSFLGLKKTQDQRLLLDTLMKAQGLDVLNENELKIHGLLYVVEFDDSLSALSF